jgi:unsaturated rhamnogalacturonyl hydrolase
LNPEHPSINTFINFCKSHLNNEGIICDNSNHILADIKTEELYTLCFPLAVVADLKKDTVLRNLALHNLIYRIHHLSDDEGMYQRRNNKGEKMYKNWGRGVTWHLLGLVRSLEFAKGIPAESIIKNELNRAKNFVLNFQQENGLWNCFIDLPETGNETSGSAGIAAALSFGLKKGVFDSSLEQNLNQVKRSLSKQLTPDGLLKGTAQANKGGIELQTQGYRVISPYTLGFFGYS